MLCRRQRSSSSCRDRGHDEYARQHLHARARRVGRHLSRWNAAIDELADVELGIDPVERCGMKQRARQGPDDWHLPFSSRQHRRGVACAGAERFGWKRPAVPCQARSATASGWSASGCASGDLSLLPYAGCRGADHTFQGGGWPGSRSSSRSRRTRWAWVRRRRTAHGSGRTAGPAARSCARSGMATRSSPACDAWRAGRSRRRRSASAVIAAHTSVACENLLKLAAQRLHRWHGLEARSRSAVEDGCLCVNLDDPSHGARAMRL